MEQLIVYTTPTCPWCGKVKQYLNEKGAQYQEVDVAADYNAAKQMVETTGQRGVPVIAKGSEYVVGFDPEKIDRILQ